MNGAAVSTTDPSSIPKPDLLKAIRELLNEVYLEPAERGTWVATPGGGTGLLDSVADLTAEQVSRTSRVGGTSIASHVEHLRWSLANVNATMRGAPWNPDWSASWSVVEVDEPGWSQLRKALRDEVEALNDVLEGAPQELSDPTALRGVLALPAHAAYHLGAVRQLVARLET